MHPETKKLTQKNMPYLTLTLAFKAYLQDQLVSFSDWHCWFGCFVTWLLLSNS